VNNPNSKIAFRNKSTAAECTWVMPATIRFRIICYAGCYPKMLRLKYTELQLCCFIWVWNLVSQKEEHWLRVF